MSERELDHLFKHKLEDLEKAPSAAAWDKVQANMKKPESHLFRQYGVAAAVVLLMIAGGVFWVNKHNNDQPAEQLAENVGSGESEVGSPKSEVRSPKEEGGSQKEEARGTVSEERSNKAEEMKENPVAEQKEPLLALNKPPRTEPAQTGNNKTENTEPKTQNHEPETGNMELTTNRGLIAESKEPETQNREPGTENREPGTENTEEQTGNTMVFDIEDFNKKAVAVAENPADEDKDKPSALKRVLEFAKNVKEGDTGLGELREAKNELFALNFKKDDNSK